MVYRKSEHDLKSNNFIDGAIYGRASTIELVNGESLKKQEFLALQFAKNLSLQTGVEHRPKYVLIEREAVSGAKRKRRELDKLEVLIRSRKIKFLIIEEPSRLSRDLKHLLEFLELCTKHGVTVHVRTMPTLNINSAEGLMFISNIGSFSQYERANTITRVKNTNYASAIREGKINGGIVIYGFKKTAVKGQWEPIPKEIKNVEFMMKTFVSSGCFSETLKIANLQGIKNKKEKPFNYNSLRRLFKNTKFIGFIRLTDKNKTICPLKFGEVIDKQLFEKVQKQIEINDNARANTNRRGDRVFLFTGLLENQNGATFSGTSCVPRNKVKKSYYIESKSKTRIDADLLEEKVLKTLCYTIETQAELEKHSKYLSDAKNQKIADIDAKIKLLQTGITENEQKEAAIVLGLTTIASKASELTIEFLNEQIRQITTFKKQSGEQLENLHQELADLKKTEVDLKKFQKRALKTFLQMKKADRIQLRNFLRQVIEKIVVKHSGEVLITWKFSEMFTDLNDKVAANKNWLRRQDSNLRPSG